MASSKHYGFWLRNLHWLIAALVIGALTLVELHDLAPKGSALRSNMMYWHMQFGMAVLILFLPRLIVRLSGKRPEVEPSMPAWMEWPARAIHLIFYTLFLVQPILGILMMEAGGHSLAFLGIPVPVMVAPNKALNQTLGDLHSICGNIFLWLALAHAAAALWHHWGRKDNTLRRMGYTSDS